MCNHNPIFTLFFTILVNLITTSGLAEQANTGLAQYVCGANEATLFEGWSRSAGAADSSRLAGIENLEPVSVKAKDGNVLHGYKLLGARSENTGAARGYVLVVQGNAMLADQILGSFVSFAGRGYDIYIFDYRGYGRSNGKPQFKAILNDYRDIIDHLDSLGYTQTAYYGLSFGGVVLLDALKKRPGKRRVVVDSTRSQFSEYGCPTANDPLANLPDDCSEFLFMAGLKDQVVTPQASAKLLTLANQRGASVVRHAEFNHPFMDRSISLHTQRMNTVESFLFDD